MVASLGFGVFVSVTQALGEGYRQRAALLFLAVPVASMFAFLLAAGTHLHLARPRDRSAGRVLRPLVAASASVPVTFGFRGSGARARPAAPSPDRTRSWSRLRFRCHQASPGWAAERVLFAAPEIPIVTPPASARFRHAPPGFLDVYYW